MTKKHYNLYADFLVELDRNRGVSNEVLNILVDLIFYVADNNFNWKRFVKYVSKKNEVLADRLEFVLRHY